MRNAPSSHPHRELACASRPGGVNGTQAAGAGLPTCPARAVLTRGDAPPSGTSTGTGSALAGRPRAALARHGGWACHRHGAHVAPMWEPGRAPTALKPPFVLGQPLVLGIQVVLGGARRKPSNRVLGSARQHGTNVPSSAGRTSTKSSRPARGALPEPTPAWARPRAMDRQEALRRRGSPLNLLAPQTPPHSPGTAPCLML